MNTTNPIASPKQSLESSIIAPSVKLSASSSTPTKFDLKFYFPLYIFIYLT